MPASAATRRVARTAPLFAALGDETRLAMVARLSASPPLSIAQLTQGTVVTRQAVTKHLHVLAHAGVVRHARHGRERLWSLDGNRLGEGRDYLELISKRWDEALARLKTFVEE